MLLAPKNEKIGCNIGTYIIAKNILFLFFVLFIANPWCLLQQGFEWRQYVLILLQNLHINIISYFY
jgi:hypothetical protein